MKNKIIKILLIFTISIIFLGINKTVQANSINKISMDIYIDDKGDAQVTEIWTCNTNQGTEVYHPYYNLGKSEITNLSVEEAERKYTTLNSWDTSGSFASKANKCGINKISNGVEICWGISSYGSHTYKIKYNISKFVSELTDAQMIYWTLIPYDFSNSIGDVKIKIYSDKYIQDTIDVWGYGNYGGLAYVNNGAIYMDSDGRLDKNEYMTILVKFPLGTFNTQNKISKQFEYYFNMAQEGSTKYNNKKENTFIIIFSVIMSFLPTIFIFLIIIFTSKNSQNGIGYAKDKKKLPKDIQYFRDIPCQGNIFEAYYIGYNYGIIKKKTDLLGALILKWIKEEKVKTKKIKINKTFGKDKEETALELIENNPNFEDEREQKLYSMLNEASGDGILEKKELEKWCRGKYNKILTWFSNAIEEEKTKLVDKGLIIKEEKTTMKIFKTTTYKVTYELTNKAIELAGLKKFLLDYTLIKEKTAIEVVLMESYLIYAQLMGIAKQVAKEFKDLYPELIEQTHYTSYEDIIWIHYCSSSGISSANSARQAAESYSSGGGGFSSGGGGGGSFGGGGGGGGFR